MAGERPSYRISAFPVTIFGHLLVVSITTLLLVWLIKLREGFAFTSEMKIKIFNLHPLLTVLGFVVFSGEAILTYKAIPATRPSLKIIHLLYHMIAFVTGILGIYAVFKFHDEIHISHMNTLHSWIGLSTICLFGLQFLLGLATFLFPGAESATRAKIAPWHILFGVIIFFLTIVSVETGITEKFMFQNLGKVPEALVINFIGLLILLFGVTVGLSVVFPLIKEKTDIQNE